MIIIILILVLLSIFYYSNNELFDNFVSMHTQVMYVELMKFIGISNCNKIDEETSICTVSDKKYIILNNDIVISDFLRASMPWEQFMHKYFIKFGDKNMNAIDIGANIGTHVVYLSNYFKTVYAFEPQKKVFEILNKNIKLNNITNVITYQNGLGNEDKIVKMRGYSNNQPENIGAINIDENGSGEEIVVKTLDSFNLTNIKFIKMDVEGYEYFVLLGGKNTILQSKPIIIIELNYTGSNYKENVLDFFKSINYKLTRFSNHDYIAEPIS